MNNHWPFSTFFLGLYHSARRLNWNYKDKPVTIAWLLGYNYCLLAEPVYISNPFMPNSLAWNDFCNGFIACDIADKRYVLEREPINV